MPSSSQLPLPLPSRVCLSRADLIVAPQNERVVGFVESWPDWPTRIAALHGPAGCGKTHLASIWAERSHARIETAAEIAGQAIHPGEALVIEDVDASEISAERDTTLFSLIEAGRSWILFTGRTPPATWACTMPDLASRFSSLTTLPLSPPDEVLLGALARKLFSDRQLLVPDAVIAAMLQRLDRTPAAIRDFVAGLDILALADNRPVSVALVHSLIAARQVQPP